MAIWQLLRLGEDYRLVFLSFAESQYVSYYNFNKHFWSTKTACDQSTNTKLNERKPGISILTRILGLACVVVWTPLLIQILFHSVQENQEKSLRDTSSHVGDCFVLKRNHLLLCRLQHQQ